MARVDMSHAAEHDKTARAAQKAILRARYPDYNAVYHDVFVARYNKDLDRAALATYHHNRGIE